jgi:RNA polymerase sigma-70 factor, ECF subfamily
LRSFLLMKGHSRSVDSLRAEWSRRNRDQRDANDKTSKSNQSYDLEREVIDLDLADRVSKALKLLPDDERRSIALAYFGGHTYRDVAQILGQPEGTVKSRIRNGLKTMRKHLGREFDPANFDSTNFDSTTNTGPSQGASR